jgi:predicted enzyme related to lactoylglutathione lyase
MAEFNGYQPGTPSWVDLGSTDVAASAAFYTTLFGWTHEDLGADFGGYGFFKLRDKMVAGVGPSMAEGAGTYWTTYIATADADETANKVEKAGGTVVAAPMDVGDTGRMAIFLDPVGAAFGVWQEGTHRGAELANEPVSFSWSEITTRDLAGTEQFYASVFDWNFADMPMPGGGGGTYPIINVGDHGVGGVVEMGDMFPAEVPPHWIVYFAVEDADDTVAKTKELGGNVVVEPMTVPDVGRFAALTGPLGENFSIIRNA